MQLNEKQFETQLGYLTSLSVFENFRNTGVITQSEFIKAKAIIEKKYRPIIAVISC